MSNQLYMVDMQSAEIKKLVGGSMISFKHSDTAYEKPSVLSKS